MIDFLRSNPQKPPYKIRLNSDDPMIREPFLAEKA